MASDAPPIGWWSSAFGRFRRNRAALVGLIVIGIFVAMALLAPWVDHHGPTRQHYDATFQGPSARFWLGTDQLGRDQYSRLVHGARVSLAVGVLSQGMGLAIGLTVGLAAGLGGRWADRFLMRLTDVTYAFPDLLMLILLISVFGSSMLLLTFAIGLVSWPTIARLARGQVLSLREEEFVVAARAVGASGWRIAGRHLLPNLLGPVIVTATFGVPAAIFAEGALAFIGLGLPPPAPSWGRLVTDSYSAILAAPHLAVTSCLAVATTMMAFSFIGDGLRDALDPRSGLRERTLDTAQAPARLPAPQETRRAA